MKINITELAFAFAAVLFGIITLFATQNVYNMYVIVLLVLMYGELTTIRESLTKKEKS